MKPIKFTKQFLKVLLVEYQFGKNPNNILGIIHASFNKP